MAKNSRFFDNNNKIIHIYGYHSVKAALKNKNRKKKRLILSDNLVCSIINFIIFPLYSK